MHRSNFFLAALALSAAVLMSSAATADIYRWDDESGNRHLVNDINEVPAEYREAAIADYEKRTAKHGAGVNVIGDPGHSSAKSAPPRSAAPPAAQGAAQAAPNPMPGGQPEMWWRQNAMKLDRNLRAAESALEKARASEDDDSVTIGRGRRGARAGTGGRGHGRHRAPRVAGDGSNDYTEYSAESDINAFEVSVEDAERAKEDFHNQARRAGVPQGWLRP